MTGWFVLWHKGDEKRPPSHRLRSAHPTVTPLPDLRFCHDSITIGPVVLPGFLHDQSCDIATVPPRLALRFSYGALVEDLWKVPYYRWQDIDCLGSPRKGALRP
jgi:hypothetical protein